MQDEKYNAKKICVTPAIALDNHDKTDTLL